MAVSQGSNGPSVAGGNGRGGIELIEHFTEAKRGAELTTRGLISDSQWLKQARGVTWYGAAPPGG